MGTDDISHFRPMCPFVSDRGPSRMLERSMVDVTLLANSLPMTSPAKKLLDEALALPEEARQELMLALGASLRPVELSNAWREEIAGRLEQIKSGNAVLLDPMEHLEELRAKFG